MEAARFEGTRESTLVDHLRMNGQRIGRLSANRKINACAQLRERCGAMVLYLRYSISVHI